MARLSVVYYTRPPLMDHSLTVVRALSEYADVHMMLELAPDDRDSGLFDEASIDVPSGVIPARPVLEAGYLAGARQFTSQLASFDLVVYSSSRVISTNTPLVTLAAATRVLALRPDVIHFEDISNRSMPMLFLPGQPKVLSIHDPGTHVGERSRRSDRVRQFYLQRARFYLLLFNRHAEQLYFSQFPRRPFSLIALPALDVFREWPGPPVPEQPHTVLFFGRIKPYKGLDVLFTCLPETAQRVPGLRVIVAGLPEGGYEPPVPPDLPPGSLVTYYEPVSYTHLTLPTILRV